MAVVQRRLMAGTGWKMNNDAAGTARYGAAIRAGLGIGPEADAAALLDLFVLPPFTSLHAAQAAFQDTPVAIGAQNVHWDESGAWTGEISAPMLAEAGCRYVALAHSERLTHFNESYALVRLKVNAALRHGITPVLCLGETADEREAGQADAVLATQVRTALADQAHDAEKIVLAYEPRWAIGGAAAASPDYVAERHHALRAHVRSEYGADAADHMRIIYGGAVTPDTGPTLIALDNVDGLFVGRAAWTADGFMRIVAIVAAAAKLKQGRHS
jgi:triosephosphate isomerase